MSKESTAILKAMLYRVEKKFWAYNKPMEKIRYMNI